MPVNFLLFGQERCGIGDIVISWLGRASVAQDDFDKFLYLWAAFNSWALIVTIPPTASRRTLGDGDMVKAIADNRRAQLFYTENVASDTKLRNKLQATGGSFPLQNFADLVYIDHQYDWRRNQGNVEYLQKIVDSTHRVRVSPALDAQDFRSVLRCIYAVRCNLIHGSKLATNQEREFVSVFSTVLDRLFAGKPSLFDLR